MTAEKLCKALGLELAGDGVREIQRVDFADDADEHALAVVRQGSRGDEVVDARQEGDELRPPRFALPVKKIDDSRRKNPDTENPKQRDNDAPEPQGGWALVASAAIVMSRVLCVHASILPTGLSRCTAFRQATRRTGSCVPIHQLGTPTCGTAMGKRGTMGLYGP